MKIEIDLNDILGDENGVESIQDSVKRQVVDAMSREIREGIKKKIDSEISRVIDESMKLAIKEHMPSLVAQVLDSPYTPVDKWGQLDRGKSTTFRTQLVKAINEEMVYKKTNYSSDRSPFTRAVDDMVSIHFETFKDSFNKTVDAEFTKQCLEHATSKLKQRLGIN